MITISLCMIVKNEEAVLARCLNSVKGIADEIIIVDTGSTDRTKEIASKYTSRIYDFLWEDDFAAARNFSFSKASMAYCLWLDADDIIDEQSRKMFLRLKETLAPETDMVMMKYHVAFDKQGSPIFSYYRERLIRSHAGYLWKGAVHEVIVPSGNILYADAAVSHKKIKPGDPDRNLRIFEKLLAEGKVLEPRQQFYYARELYYHRRFREAISVFTRFLDQGSGWAENNIDSCRILASCYLESGSRKEAIYALLRSLEYDIPRAEVCCDIGSWFMEETRWKQAIYWYEQALGCKREGSSGAFVLPDCYDYIPCLQLCVCYDRLGEHETAAAYNERAGKAKPDSPQVISNRRYFASLTHTE